MTFLLLIILVIVLLFTITEIRTKYLTKPIFVAFKKILPPMSTTEKTAMEAGDVWWDGEIFSGKPDWQKLHD